MTKYIEGQEVRVFDSYTRKPNIGDPGVVTKVGRTVVTVKVGTWREVRFDIESGAEKRSINAPGIGDKVRTLAEVAQQNHRRRIIYDLADFHGLDIPTQHRRSIPTAKLAQILDAADTYDREHR